MASTKNEIDGLTMTQLSELRGPRGSVLHMLRCDSSDFTRFGESYFSEILPGAVNAWKRHRAQTQNLAVPVGRIQTVVYDDRAGSPTCGQVKSLEMGRPDAYIRLCIPPELWYGFKCLSDTPALIANCTDMPHDPEEGEVRSIDDPDMPHFREILLL